MNIAFLLEMGWKSALIAVLGLVLLALLRGRSARDRATFLRVAVLMLLTLPLMAALGPKIPVEHPPLMPAAELAAAPGQTAFASRHGAPALTSAGLAAPAFDIGWPAMLFALYLAGVAAVLARLGLGLLTLREWTRRSRPLREFNWRIAFDRALLHAGFRVPVGSADPVRLLVSHDSPSPLAWGLRKPAILIDTASAARPQDAEAILAHELAHVARHDWLHLMLARVAVALFWFNPLVWLLERRLVQAAEEAADMHAVERLDPAGYAQVLLACIAAPLARALPATAIASDSGLGRRVTAVLDAAERGRGSGSIWTALGIGACVAAAAPIAAVELMPATPKLAAPVVAETPVAMPVQVAPAAQAAPASLATEADAASAASEPELAEVARLLEESPAPPVAGAPPAPSEPLAAPMPPVRAHPAPPMPPSAPAAPVVAVAPMVSVTVSPPAPPLPPEPYFDPDALAEMRSMGISPGWMVEMARAMGRSRISVDDAMELKSMGISPSRVRDYAAAGYPRIKVDDLVELAAMGISPGYVREMVAAGFAGLKSDDLAELRSMGVSPTFARRMREERGVTSIDELVELRLNGGR
ncbi:M56 family metallopeptidase [Sandaracinobacteroides hominis]|uniref:M56 family metallopeptidase n=1 Tax=Sandaracinobacteroides hominis TaxID=2780086 RepID=UPI0018F6AEDF|nr:M56 family metallopeptidase [Sandaracinobacteroides hominis]